jgi:hypothetical protein
MMDGQPTEDAVPQQPGPEFLPYAAPISYGTAPSYGAPTPYGPGSSYGQPAAYGSSDPYGTPTPYSSPTGYGYPQPGYFGPIAGSQRNALGVWALVLGIVGVVFAGILAGIPAIILGNMSKGAVARGEANNPGLGTAGVIMGWISVGFMVIGALFFVGLVVLAASTSNMF